MDPTWAVVWAAVITTVGSLATVAFTRWDKNSGKRDKRDARVMAIEQSAFDRATASDIDLIQRLTARVASAEERADRSEALALKLSQRVFRLEQALIAAGLDLPN